MKVTSVYVWLPGSASPIKAGNFYWDDSMVSPVGSFEYLPEYLGNPYRFPLDPIELPLKRGKSRTAADKGIFGVIRDSGPDSWGRGIIKKKLGELDDFDYLINAGIDGVGAITVGDVEKAKRPFSFTELNEASNRLKNQEKTERVEQELITQVTQTTSLGGAKPKVTLEHDGHLWIAKFPERSDSHYLPHNEHVMLKMAGNLGIQVPDSFVHTLPHGKTMIMVKRFDRYAFGGGFARIPFASAHTVLGLSSVQSQENDKKKSYLRLADVSLRWVGKQNDVANKLAIWDRIVFNALVGNIDDHARNHGFIYDHEKATWRLSPAFDILAFPYTGNLALSLGISREGSLVTEEKLMNTAVMLGIDPEFASKRLLEMATYVKGHWTQFMIEEGVPDDYIELIAPAFRFSTEVLNNHARMGQRFRI